MGAILLATLFWGMTFAFIKTAVSDLSPYNFLFWRFGSAFLFLIFFKMKLLKREFRKSLIPGSLLGIFLFATVLFQTIGLQTISASTASFITGLSVILVPLFLSVGRKKMPKLKIIAASIIALTGIGLISLHDDLALSAGEIWVLFCAICFAIYIILAGKHAPNHHPLVLSTLQCLVIFFFSGLFALFSGTLELPKNIDAWTSILFCSIFASIFAFLLQLHFQRYISSSTTAIIFSCEPIFATITAMILLHERPSELFYIGACLIFLAMIISEINLKKKRMPQT